MSGDGDRVEQFDTLFLSIAQHHPEGASQLLDTFVGFLSRKTDFFTGGEEGQWEKIVMSTFRKYEKISREKHKAEVQEKKAKEAAKKAAQLKKEAENIVKPAEITELTDAEADKLQMEIDAKKIMVSPESGESSSKKPVVVGDDDEDTAERETLNITNKASRSGNFKSNLKTEEENLFLQNRAKFLKSINLTKEEIEELEQNTIGQSYCPLWNYERSKRITASNFGRICKMKENTHCKNIIKSLLYNTFPGNSATTWGKEHEKIAIKQFESILNITVDECGFFVDCEKGYLGASPDGLIGRYTIVEVKCPINCIDMTPIQGILSGKIKFAKVVAGKMELLTNHNYYYQIQGQLHVTGRKMCYFIVWTPMGLEYQKIRRNDEFWRECCERQLDDFFQYCFLPEKINPRHPHKEILDLRPHIISRY